MEQAERLLGYIPITINNNITSQIIHNDNSSNNFIINDNKFKTDLQAHLFNSSSNQNLANQNNN